MREINAITQALADYRASGKNPIDLTVSNPTLVDLPYPPHWLQSLGLPENAFPYSAQPQGEIAARQGIAQYLREQGMEAQAENIVLTSGTSEAYAWIFRALSQAGDEIATMTPGYPLCDALAQWCGLALLPWPWRRSEGGNRWFTDWNGLEQALSTKTKALILIHPNNPTGQYLTENDFAEALALAERHGLALIVDTVFWDYSLGNTPPCPVPASRGPLVFTLGGLSKTCALPQVKLAWMHITGDRGQAGGHGEKILDALLWTSDAFLSVSTPIQRIAPRLLQERALIQGPLIQRIRDNRDFAHALLDPDFDPQMPEAGWSLPIRLPHCPDDEKAAISLLLQEGVLAQPGYFYDFPEDGYLAVSLITPPDLFKNGIARAAHFARRQGWTR